MNEDIAASFLIIIGASLLVKNKIMPVFFQK